MFKKLFFSLFFFIFINCSKNSYQSLITIQADTSNDFGEVELGASSSPLLFTIYNNSKNKVYFSNDSNDIFKYSEDVFPGKNGTCKSFLDTNSNCKIELVFSPTQLKVYLVDLNLNYSDKPDYYYNSSQSISLKGEGILGDVIYLAGSYGIRSLNTDGTAFSYFNSDIYDNINGSAIQSDAKIIIPKGFKNISRLSPLGELDETFKVGSINDNEYILSIITDAQDNIFLGGTFTQYNNFYKSKIIKLKKDGTIDNAFDIGYGIDGSVWIVSLDNIGKLLVGGLFDSYNDVPIKNIVRVHSNGTQDTTFDTGTGPNSTVYSIAVQSDNKVLLGGDFTSFNDTPTNRIVRLNNNGTIDSGFNIGSGFNASVRYIYIQKDSKILVGGYFTTYKGVPAKYIVRLNFDGSIDDTFSCDYIEGNQAHIRTIIVQDDDKILLGGKFGFYDDNDIFRTSLIRINEDGSLDETFVRPDFLSSDSVTNSILIK